MSMFRFQNAVWDWFVASFVAITDSELLGQHQSDYLFRQTDALSDNPACSAGLQSRTLASLETRSTMRIIKRAFDIVVSSLLLVVFAPAFAIIAVAVKFESRGPVFFKQLRALSDDDQPFVLYKFRSMVSEAEKVKDILFNLNEANGVLFKIKNDPRLTRFGRFMRRYSIDELPQLLNVLKGEMSLVGPRPLPAKDLQLLERYDRLRVHFRYRRNSKPGMTGLWQISGRSDLGFCEMVMLDVYYIENQRLLFDLEILLRTIPVVMFAKGAY